MLSDPEREYAGFAHTGIKWTPLSESLTEEELVALQSSAQAEANAEITRDGELEAR